jgi:hypothetical protein
MRVLNNLGMVHASAGEHAEAVKLYEQALSLPEDTPRLRAGTLHNLATSLVQIALQVGAAAGQEARLRRAVDAFEAAQTLRLELGLRPDWAATTANLASARVALGVAASRTDAALGIMAMREVVGLYLDALPALPPAEASATLDNVRLLRRIIGELPGGTALAQEEPSRRLFAQLASDTTAAAPEWPRESYAHAHRTHGEDIVQFLSRVWLPFIASGQLDLRTLRKADPSAAKAIDNYTRRIDPDTGERRRLPPHLALPTLREVNDRLAAQAVTPGQRSARLDWALRARERRLRK